MKYRNATLLTSESIATAATKVIDISVKDVISRIAIQVKATNNGAAPTAHPATILSKIELVDGSDVLFSLSGKECMAMEFYDTKNTPFGINCYLNDVMNIMVYNINFGRHLYDPILAFDPKKFMNPQLKITHNLASGGSSPDAATLRVSADVFDEREVSPIGFLMNKEPYSYSLTSSGYEYIDLPTDHILRGLMILSLSASKQPYEQYNEIKISEDNDKRIPIDSSTSDLVKYFANLYGKINESVYGAALTTTRDFYIMSTYEVMAAAAATGFAASYIKSELAYGGNIDIRGSAAANFMANITGFCPFGGLYLPFGDPKDPDDWYDTTKVGNLQLRIKGGSSVGSGSTCQVVTQQLRKYAGGA